MTPRDQGARRRAQAATAAALVAALVLALALPAGAADPAPGELPAALPGDRLLVQTRTAEGAMALATVDRDGGDRQPLTSGHDDFAPAWSPDGRWVAFLRVEVPVDGLWVVPAGGGEARRLADRGHSPSWAPDSRRLVYSPSTEANPEPLRIADLDGSTTPIPGTDGGINPVWSPDGRTIAYIEPRSGYALVLVRPDGSGRTVVMAPAEDPVWAPDSLSVAFVRRTGGHSALLRSDGAGSEVFLVTDAVSHIQQLAYSPAGDRIAFAGGAHPGELHLWTARVADGALRQLTSGPADDFAPVWAPSAGWLAFSRSSDIGSAAAPVDVWRVPAAGGAAQQVTSTGADHAAGVGPGITLRLTGVERIGTAVALARTIPEAGTVVLARADDPADALAGAPLAAALDAPLLLSAGDRLAPEAAAEIARLGAERAVLLGGRAALQPQVEVDLAAAGVTDVTRLAGATRFATAALIAEALADVAGAPQRVLVAEGLSANHLRGWPDALSASALAVHTGEPVLLVTRDELPQDTADAIAALGAEAVTVVGGAAAVSEAVATELGGVEGVETVERVAGADRYATSALAADLALAAGAEARRPWLATGRAWPDALAAAPAAARDGGVVLLVDGRDPAGAPAARNWLADHGADRGVVVGGTAAITPPARAALEAALAG